MQSLSVSSSLLTLISHAHQTASSPEPSIHHNQMFWVFFFLLYICAPWAYPTRGGTRSILQLCTECFQCSLLSKWYVCLHGLHLLCNYAANFPPNAQPYTLGEFAQPQTSISASSGARSASQRTKNKDQICLFTTLRKGVVLKWR